MFGIEPGDQLLLLGDVERGIGILPKKMLHDLLGLIGATLGEQGKWSGKRTKEEHDGRKRS